MAQSGTVGSLEASMDSLWASLVVQWQRICLQCRGHRFDPWVRKIPWRRKWQPTPVCLPGKSRGQKSLGGYSLCGHRRVGNDLATKQQQWTHYIDG